MEIRELHARVRNEYGDGPARRLRKEGLVPAVLYGPRTETVPLTINSSDLMKLLRKKEDNVFIQLVIDDQGKKIGKISILKELQTEPVTGRFYHADFCEINVDDKLVFDIPLHFTGKPLGVEDGGNFQHVKRELKVSCLPSTLPPFIEVDVSGLRIGDAIKVQNINLADGITVLDPEDMVIAVITAPKAVIEAEKEDEPKLPAEGKE
jgi:large subunit ribosomal protein L25